MYLRVLHVFSRVFSTGSQHKILEPPPEDINYYKRYDWGVAEFFDNLVRLLIYKKFVG